MNQPEIVKVDPQRIKFNPKNPRQHQGTEFDRLKQSVKEVGVVQLPTVRVLPGGFYEAIDGEGRVRSAQEARKPFMYAVSYGQVDDQEALTMLQASNSVRSFSFLAECRGLANMHRQGQTGESIAKKMGTLAVPTSERIAIGYFPDQIMSTIQNALLQQGEDGFTWAYASVRRLLPLRQLLPGQRKPGDIPPGQNTSSGWSQIDGAYDYHEVQQAVERIVQGDIKTREQLISYVEQRRRELFEKHFNEEMRKRLEAEIAQTKQALEESYTQKMQGVQQQTAQRYESQVAILQKQYADLEKQYQKLVTDVAKRPEIIAEREKQLQQKLKEAEAERTRFQTLQSDVQLQIQKAQQEAQQVIQRQLSEAIKEQRKSMDAQLAQARADMEDYYAKRDQDRQIKAETSIRQAVAHGTELLSQTQQSFLHLMSPNFVKGIAWLSNAEIAGLLAQIAAVQQTLDNAKEDIQETIKHGATVASGVPVLTEEGSIING
jgi:ParB-like chromosome segregation protein Spo0J